MLTNPDCRGVFRGKDLLKGKAGSSREGRLTMTVAGGRGGQDSLHPPPPLILEHGQGQGRKAEGFPIDLDLMPVNLAPFDPLVQGGYRTRYTKCLCHLDEATTHQFKGVRAIFTLNLAGDF